MNLRAVGKAWVGCERSEDRANAERDGRDEEDEHRDKGRAVAAANGHLEEWAVVIEPRHAAPQDPAVTDASNRGGVVMASNQASWAQDRWRQLEPTLCPFDNPNTAMALLIRERAGIALVAF